MKVFILNSPNHSTDMKMMPMVMVVPRSFSNTTRTRTSNVVPPITGSARLTSIRAFMNDATVAADQIARASLASSDGWKEMPAITNQLRAPICSEPIPGISTRTSRTRHRISSHGEALRIVSVGNRTTATNITKPIAANMHCGQKRA